MVPELKSWKVLLAAMLLIAGIGTVLAFSASSDDEPDGALSAIRGVIAPDDEARGGEPGGTTEVSSGSTTPLTGTENVGSATRPGVPRVKDVPSPPAAGPSAEQQWQRYLADTKAVVNAEASDLTAMIASVTLALSGGDAAALTGMIAPDEGDQSAYLSGLADRYPTILESTPAGNVNIFSSGGATLYFGYAIVEWTDAGIRSEHTIPIMLRYVDDRWYITTLGDTGGDLQFVQSVTL